jgi:hypothetical protein
VCVKKLAAYQRQVSFGHILIVWKPAPVVGANQGTSFGGPSQAVGIGIAQCLNSCKSRVEARDRPESSQKEKSAPRDNLSKKPAFG